eukprot:7061905-Pyramimonas_sp.AAC.1
MSWIVSLGGGGLARGKREMIARVARGNLPRHQNVALRSSHGAGAALGGCRRLLTGVRMPGHSW